MGFKTGFKIPFLLALVIFIISVLILPYYPEAVLFSVVMAVVIFVIGSVGWERRL